MNTNCFTTLNINILSIFKGICRGIPHAKNNQNLENQRDFNRNILLLNLWIYRPIDLGTLWGHLPDFFSIYDKIYGVWIYKI